MLLWGCTIPADYNDNLVREQTKTLDLISNLNASLNKNDLKKAHAIWSEAIKQSKEPTNKVKQMSPFRKETGLRDAMANLLEFYQLVLIKDYRTIFEIKRSALAEEEKNAKIKSILDQIRKKEAVLIESFREQEVSFAREYDIQLVSSGI